MAETVADALHAVGSVSVLAADKANLDHEADLLIIGGPTEGHGMTPAMKQCLARVDHLSGVRAAAFDTRSTWPIWLGGSAAKQIAKRLEELGADLVVPAESFLVTKEPNLCVGELERAARWALSLVPADRVAKSLQ